jgi:hypothetical protein
VGTFTSYSLPAFLAHSVPGQTEKNSVRANVFRFALELRHSLMTSVLRICATSGRMRRPLIELHRRQNGYIGSISPGCQVLLNQGSSGPYSRKRVFQPFPGIVCTQLVSLPAGAFGPK